MIAQLRKITENNFNQDLAWRKPIEWVVAEGFMPRQKYFDY